MHSGNRGLARAETTLETSSVFNGNTPCQTGIALLTGATLNGKAFAQTAVTLQSSAVTGFSHSTVPEFLSILILPLAMLATLFAIVIYRKKAKN